MTGDDAFWIVFWLIVTLLITNGAWMINSFVETDWEKREIANNQQIITNLLTEKGRKK